MRNKTDDEDILCHKFAFPRTMQSLAPVKLRHLWKAQTCSLIIQAPVQLFNASTDVHYTDSDK
ncbi:MAG: hypothetical protein P4M11_01885 [Candidatus Pacebacteria bacterium]|nr:hypothetical protein [Candidatus Paceibacterota bacterium]